MNLGNLEFVRVGEKREMGGKKGKKDKGQEKDPTLAIARRRGRMIEKNKWYL
jgi:hypothetical protein